MHSNFILGASGGTVMATPSWIPFTSLVLVPNTGVLFFPSIENILQMILSIYGVPSKTLTARFWQPPRSCMRRCPICKTSRIMTWMLIVAFVSILNVGNSTHVLWHCHWGVNCFLFIKLGLLSCLLYTMLGALLSYLVGLWCSSYSSALLRKSVLSSVGLGFVLCGLRWQIGCFPLFRPGFTQFWRFVPLCLVMQWCSTSWLPWWCILRHYLLFTMLETLSPTLSGSLWSKCGVVVYAFEGFLPYFLRTFSFVGAWSGKLPISPSCGLQIAPFLTVSLWVSTI